MGWDQCSLKKEETGALLLSLHTPERGYVQMGKRQQAERLHIWSPDLEAKPAEL